MYTIGQVAKKMNLSVPTLRYYDDEGLLINVKREANGNRVFDDNDIEALILINCLKSSGMKIKEIKDFMDLCKLGNDSLAQRLEFFNKKEQDILMEMEALEKTLAMIKYKQWYYETAVAHNDENYVKNMPQNNIPNDALENFIRSHQF